MSNSSEKDVPYSSSGKAYELPAFGPDFESFYDLPAKIINLSSKILNFKIPPNEIPQFNNTWKTRFLEILHKNDKKGLNEFLKTGKSNGNKLYFQVLQAKPNEWRNLHCHPNIEFVYVIKGTIHEYMMTTVIENCPSSGEMIDITNLGYSPKFKKRIHNSGEFFPFEMGSVHQSYAGDKGFSVLLLWSTIHISVNVDEKVLQFCPKLSKL